MKRASCVSLACAAAVVIATAAAGPAAHAKTEPRAAFAAHELETLDGKATSLSSLRGEVLVVNFWASWCPPCRKELPVMDAWNAEWSARGARVVAISIDRDVRKARRFAERANLSLTLLHDGPDGLARKLDLPSLPCTYVLDRDGRVVTVVKSSSEADLERVRSRVEELLNRPDAGRDEMTSGGNR